MSEVLSLTVASPDGGEHRHDLESTGHHVVECRDDPTLPGYCTLRFTRPSTPAPPGCEPLPASQA
jgi:chitosanase